MTHEKLISIAENVVVVRPVLGKVQAWIFKDGNKIGETFDHRLTLAQLVRVVKVREVGACKAGICVDERLNDLGVDLAADVTRSFQGHHVCETGTRWNSDRRLEVVGVAVLVRDIFDKQHEQDIVLILAGIHATPQFIAGCPEGGVEF